MRGLHLYMNRLLMAGIVAQVCLAGAGIFGAASFNAHAMLGWLLIIAALLSAAFAAIAPLPAGQRVTAAVLLALVVMQPVFVIALRRYPPVAAAHVPNALVIAVLCLHIDRKLAISKPTA
jgi:hypothetical protein